MLIWDQFGIIQSLQMSPIPQTGNWSGTFLYTQYSKGALIYTTTLGGKTFHLFWVKAPLSQGRQAK